MNIYINNTRTFDDYRSDPHHHDFMLANRCMAGANDDQRKVDIPKTGDVVALYANGLGLIAFDGWRGRTAEQKPPVGSASDGGLSVRGSSSASAGFTQPSGRCVVRGLPLRGAPPPHCG